MNTSDLKSFHYLENGEVSFSMLDTIKTAKTLDVGSYNLSYEDYPVKRIVLKKQTNIETIKIHNFPDGEKLNDLFTAFFNKKVVNKMSKLGFNHKIGLLLYGKEGTGKSTIIRYYADKAIKEHNAIVFYMPSSYIFQCWEFITNIRRIQNNPIVVIYEEMDQLIENRNEGTLKTILDGDSSIDNCITMATTNYLNKIPEALKDRPSRFKYALNIEGIHERDNVFELIDKMLNDLFTDEEIWVFADELKGQTLDMIKQFCIDKIMDLKTYGKKSGKMGFVVNN